MSIRESNKVDVVGRDRDSKEYLLGVVVDEPWVDSDEFRSALVEKLNQYCSYFLDGQMKREYTDCTQLRIRVQLLLTEDVPEHSQEFLTRVIKAFAAHGLDIETKVLDK